MSLDQILDKIYHIFWVFKYFLCVLGIFWVDPTWPEPNPIHNRTESESTNSNNPIGSNYLRPDPDPRRSEPIPNREF